MIIAAKPDCRIPLGKTGENLVTAVQFDKTAWVTEFGQGVFELVHRRHGEEDALPTVIESTPEGVITWTLSEADTAIRGVGECQLIFETLDGHIRKSEIWETIAGRSLTSAEEVPSPMEGWVGQVLQAAVDADLAKTSAEAASQAAEAAGAGATAARDEAVSARDAAVQSRITAEYYEIHAGQHAASAQADAAAAAQSAASAAADRTAAESARTAAETAQDTAETAAAAAEDSAESAAESARHLTIDDTLTYEGQAADAKATGDAFALIDNRLEAVENLTGVSVKTYLTGWQNGRINPSTGYQSSERYVYSETLVNDNTEYYFDDTTYRLIFCAYTSADNDATTDTRAAISSWMTTSPARSPLYKNNYGWVRIMLDPLNGGTTDPSSVSVYTLESETSAIVEAVSGLETAILGDTLTYNNMSGFAQYQGYVMTDGTWTTVGPSNVFTLFPLPDAGFYLTITANAQRDARVLFFKTFADPVAGASADLTDEYDSVVTIASGERAKYEAPSDCNYIGIYTRRSAEDCTPENFVIGKENGKIQELDSRISEIEDSTEELLPQDTITDISEYQTYLGNLGGTSTTRKQWKNINNSNYKYVIVPVKAGSKLTITAAENIALHYTVFRSYAPPQVDTEADFSHYAGWEQNKELAAGKTVSTIIPNDGKYLYVQVVWGGNSCYPAAIRISKPDQIVWAAMGDSITEGYFSVIGGAEDTETAAEGFQISSYTAWVSSINDWVLKNLGVGGSGWIKRGTGSAPKLNAIEQLFHRRGEYNGETIDCIDFLGQYPDVPYVFDFSGVDICSVMLGVNDWKGSAATNTYGTIGTLTEPDRNYSVVYKDGHPYVSETIGYAESIYGNMEFFLQNLQARNPKMKIVILSPVNSWRTSDGTSSRDVGYGIGYAFFGGKTLGDMCDAERTVAKKYGIQFIDLLYEGPISVLNCEALIGDKVHPTLDGHEKIGRDLAVRLSYK